MNNQTIYWVWIQQVGGYGNVTPTRVREHYTFAEDFYRASYEEKAMYLGINESKEAFSGISRKKMHDAGRILDYCEKNNIEIIVPGDVYYPKQLLPLRNMPAALYVKGDLSLFKSMFNLAIVGTRHPTMYGEFMARAVSEGFVKNGAVIISGGAKGIDSVAHKTTLFCGGKTICVLGCGIGYNYPAENKPMYDQIAEEGLLVSEYVPMFPTGRMTFKIRDRLISGLSSCVAVIEANKKSGSLVTADFALKQKRPLFALRKPDGSPVSEGTEEAIKRGAKPFVFYIDIIKNYHDEIRLFNSKDDVPEKTEKDRKVSGKSYIDAVYTVDFTKYFKKYQGRLKEEGYYTEVPVEDINETNINDDNNNNKTGPADEEPDRLNEGAVLREELPDNLTDFAKELYCIITDEPIHIDVLLLKTGRNISDVSSALTELELYGLIAAAGGNMYKRI